MLSPRCSLPARAQRRPVERAKVRQEQLVVAQVTTEQEVEALGTIMMEKVCIHFGWKTLP